jgi:hypothetical protein
MRMTMRRHPAPNTCRSRDTDLLRRNSSTAPERSIDAGSKAITALSRMSFIANAIIRSDEASRSSVDRVAVEWRADLDTVPPRS